MAEALINSGGTARYGPVQLQLWSLNSLHTRKIQTSKVALKIAAADPHNARFKAHPVRPI